MRNTLVGILVLAGLMAAAQDRKAATPDALKAEIDALKPAKLVWHEIPWKTCPLEALKESREQKKPVIVWVFLGTPSDERC